MNPYQRAGGIVLIVIGAVWFLQGIGVAKGSVMTGSTLWGILGAIFFAAGALLLWHKPKPPADSSADASDEG
jgi:hypothetical protein